MNALVKSEPKLMLLEYMADKYSLRPDEFGKTVRATCGLSTATPEQVAAFLIVSKEYNLNPLPKEIYAFPGRGGGIVPIVSIDGWVNLVNSNPQCDGFEFEMEHTPDGKLIACTCTMHRKDRSHPVVVTEYLSECKRATDPWKMEHRMLRHKAMIQAARYAFGFAGIYDEDEGRTIADSDVTSAGPRDSAPPRNLKTIEHYPEKIIEHQPETGSHISGDPVDDIPEDQKSDKVFIIQPHDLTPQQGDSYEAWATRYLAALETSPDTDAVFAWIDKNVSRLKKLEGSPEWTGKVKKATATIVDRLRKVDEKPKEAQPLLLNNMDADAPPADKKPRGRPRGSSKPDFTKDYDKWLSWRLDQITNAATPE